VTARGATKAPGSPGCCRITLCRSLRIGLPQHSGQYALANFSTMFFVKIGAPLVCPNDNSLSLHQGVKKESPQCPCHTYGGRRSILREVITCRAGHRETRHWNLEDWPVNGRAEKNASLRVCCAKTTLIRPPADFPIPTKPFARSAEKFPASVVAYWTIEHAITLDYSEDSTHFNAA
jgi:hypothetical protein